MNSAIQARMDDRRKPCTLCDDGLTYGDGMCATCTTTLYVGKVVKTKHGNYRQRDGVMEVKRAGETRYTPVVMCQRCGESPAKGDGYYCAACWVACADAMVALRDGKITPEEHRAIVLAA